VKVEFIKSALKLEDCPALGYPEVAFFGRSNAGKSSLLNAWTGRKNLAFVSQTPGHTQTLNFYKLEEKFIAVDLPGYGFAKRDQQLREDWAPYIERYLAERPELRGVVLIHDVIRDWSQDEENLVNWLAEHQRPVVVVLNKIDRLNQKEFQQRRKALHAVTTQFPHVFMSARSRLGIDEFNRTVFDNLLRP
jgi:GTP-binding protein